MDAEKDQGGWNVPIYNRRFSNNMYRLPALPQPPLRRIFLFLLLLITLVTAAEKETGEQCSAPSSSANKATIGIRNYYHIVVLVHGYMGSDREQEYLGEALIKESKKSIQSLSNSNDKDDDSCQHQHSHQFVVLTSKANMNDSTDGVAKGGQRLADELSDWIQQHTAEMQLLNSNSTFMTLSLIGNSLGGLYSRYALAELYYEQQDVFDKILPLVFCTTSSPHLGVSQETFIQLPKWIEPYVAMAMQQQTMDDLFGVNNSTVLMDMCHSDSNNGSKRDRSYSFDDHKNNKNKSKDRDYLHPLQHFQKRIALANAYNTDFLVSVSSAAFLSSDSDSVHHHQYPDATAAAATTSTRTMKNIEHVALQVTTTSATERTARITATGNDGNDDAADDFTRSSCVNSLDRLGWHKIFIDTRNILPDWLRLSTPKFVPRLSYTSKDLQEQFKRYGVLLPIAHPLNMANSKTDWYRKVTKSGQPIMDALAELMVLDMMELSEKKHTRKHPM